jgi:hypothetical protein
LIEIRLYHGCYVRSLSRDEIADIYELYNRLECFAVELAVPQMSDCDVRQFENILLVAWSPLQRGDMKAHDMREREFYENYRRAIRKFGAHRGAEAVWVENPALWHILRREWGSFPSVLQTDTSTSYKRSRRGTLHAPPFSSTPYQEVILARFPNEMAFRRRYVSCHRSLRKSTCGGFLLQACADSDSCVGVGHTRASVGRLRAMFVQDA